MKIRNLLEFKDSNFELPIYRQEKFEEDLTSKLEVFNTNINKVIDGYFKQKTANEVYTFLDKKKQKVLKESENRSSIRMSILNNAWRATIKFERPSVRDIKGEERDNIIKFLIEHKDNIKFSSLKNDKFGFKESINNAIDIVFNKSTLSKVFEENDKALFFAITGEIKKHLSREIVESKTYRLNTEKRTSQYDITFLRTLKRKNLESEPFNSGTFPDYLYTFSNEAGYDGEDDIRNFLNEAGIRGTFKQVFIEMKGGKSSRVVASQTTPEKFFNTLGDDLSKRIKNMEIGDDPIKLDRDEFRSFIDAANLEYAFNIPILFVKSALNKLLIFYIGDRDFSNFKLKRLKKSLSLTLAAIDESGKKEEKMFSVEFTGKAYEKIFGEK